MEILEAYDPTRCAHSAGQLAGCDPKTVKRYVARRDAGGGDPFTRTARPKLIDAFLPKVEELRRNVRAGDTVFVRRAGDVIPEVTGAELHDRPADAVLFEPPTVCPRCGGDIDRSQKRWRCIRGRACGAHESLAYYAARDSMDIEGLGDKIIDIVVAASLVTDPADLYDLDVATLAALDLMGEVSAGKLVANIQASKAQSLSRVLTGLGVRMTGRSISRRLARHFGTVQALLDASVEDLQQVEGVGPERAVTIAAELLDLAPVIGKLTERGVKMTEPGGGAAAASAPPGDQRDFAAAVCAAALARATSSIPPSPEQPPLCAPTTWTRRCSPRSKRWSRNSTRLPGTPRTSPRQRKPKGSTQLGTPSTTSWRLHRARAAGAVEQAFAEPLTAALETA